MGLMHYGMPRRSGRYPWGSGKDPRKNPRDLVSTIDDLKKQGLSDAEIAKGLGFSSATDMRLAKSSAKNEIKADNIAQARNLKEKGWSNVAIGKEMGLNESSVRELLKADAGTKKQIVDGLKTKITERLDQVDAIDIGAHVEKQIGVSRGKLDSAIHELVESGQYKIQYVPVRQLGTKNETNTKVLVRADGSWLELKKNPGKIKTLDDYTLDDGLTYVAPSKPVQVSSKRVGVRWAEDGGADLDGVVELRRGVKDLDLGGDSYGQVRIAVDKTHYIKGMAVYADDLPPGIDMRVNSNKPRSGDVRDALKKVEPDPERPFGAITRPKMVTDKNGKQYQTALNMVNEQGDWDRWARKLPSQVLSKQTPALAKEQLAITREIRKDEFSRIMSLTNPTVKKRLLQAFADGVDSDAVDLKAAALPRQRTHVILPGAKVKETEIYAPNYKNGEKVVLIRYPHGGTFEIPELRVNNRNPVAKKLLGNTQDAVIIHPKTASKLSGADFDGDTVAVIPNPKGRIKHQPPLAGLKDFEPKAKYKLPADIREDDPRVLKKKRVQAEMGSVSNLITDMTLFGASNSELTRAVRHSMVVIDAHKHKLDYKQSAKDNDIESLKRKYQPKPDGTGGGAATLLSRSTADARIPERRAARTSEGGAIDPRTGRKRFVETGKTYKKLNPRTGVWEEHPVLVKAKRGSLVDDARELASKNPRPIEAVYVHHANEMKALANKARLELLKVPLLKQNPSAKKAYQKEVESLKAKLFSAEAHRPVERQAQAIGNSIYKARAESNPGWDDKTLEKERRRALREARARVGADKAKAKVDISPREWEAIQAGAVSDNFLSRILDNTDLDQVKSYATPRGKKEIPAARRARAKTLLDRGFTQAEVADLLDISVSSVNEIGKEG